DEGLQLLHQEAEIAVRQGRAAVDAEDVVAHVGGQRGDQVRRQVLAQAKRSVADADHGGGVDLGRSGQAGDVFVHAPLGAIGGAAGVEQVLAVVHVQDGVGRIRGAVAR